MTFIANNIYTKTFLIKFNFNNRIITKMKKRKFSKKNIEDSL